MDALIYTQLPNKINTNSLNSYSEIGTNLQQIIGPNTNNSWESIITETTKKRACCNNTTNINVKIPIPTEHTPGGVFSKYGYIEKQVEVPTTMCNSTWNANYCDTFKNLYCANLLHNFRQNLDNQKLTYDMAIYPDWEIYRSNDCATFNIGDIPKIIDTTKQDQASCTAPNFWDTTTSKCLKRCEPTNLFIETEDKKKCKLQVSPPKNPPSPITVVSKESNNITISFPIVAFANSYDYKFKLSSSNTFNPEVNVSASTGPVNITIRDLIPNSNYDISVRARNQGGPSSSWTEITNILTKPSAPTGINFTNITSNSITINWTSVGSNIDYKIFQSTSQTFENTPTHTVNNLTTKNITGLLPNTNYYFKIKASNASGESSDSDIKQVLTLTTSSNINLTNNQAQQQVSMQGQIQGLTKDISGVQGEDAKDEEEEDTSYLIWIILGIIICIIIIGIAAFFIFKSN
jgi:hypothetical protein